LVPAFLRVAGCGFLLVSGLLAQLTPTQKAANLDSFEVVWRTIRDQNPDPKLNGLDWQAIHDTTKPLVESAQSADDFRRVISEMLAKLEASHHAIIASDRYQAAPQAPPSAPSDVPEGTLVHFGNLPESRLIFESRTLPGGAGYIRFNEFLDPASIMPKFQAAVKSFSDAPGIMLDLRGNPGGIGIMAMGIAGFFIEKEGLKLGEMKTRETTLKFTIFPRPEVYAGPLAILVDEHSASTTEILAGGLQDLGRAHIFGVRSAGAALPSDIIRLPNGDGFQYAQASYTSFNGKVLEGNGVTPDVVVRQIVEATAAGRDLVIEAADAWIHNTPQH
jgi:C-terminal processing protease CtpA/Prc